MSRTSVWRIGKSAARATAGMVVTEHEAATEAGLAVLRRGGNAMDAAVTAMFVLGVVEPAACGIGGGGILLVDRPGWPAPKAIDFTMTAPQMAPDAFELLEGISTSRFGWRKVRGDANLAGFSAAATPGFVAGLALALSRFGTLSPSDVLAPAIEMADTGIETPWTTTLRISASLRAFAAYPDSMATFAPDGVPLNPGGAYSNPTFLFSRPLPGRFGRLPARVPKPSTVARSQRRSIEGCGTTVGW